MLRHKQLRLDSLKLSPKLMPTKLLLMTPLTPPMQRYKRLRIDYRKPFPRPRPITTLSSRPRPNLLKKLPPTLYSN